jgi:hypothetical protein
MDSEIEDNLALIAALQNFQVEIDLVISGLQSDPFVSQE